jgi:hypothetical protein
MPKENYDFNPELVKLFCDKTELLEIDSIYLENKHINYLAFKNKAKCDDYFKDKTPKDEWIFDSQYCIAKLTNFGGVLIKTIVPTIVDENTINTYFTTDQIIYPSAIRQITFKDTNNTY